MLFIALLMPVFAQTGQAAADNIYEIRPKDGTESYFAYIDNPSSDTLRVRVYYKPGLNPGTTDTVLKNKVEFSLVGKKLADKEIEKRVSRTHTLVNGKWVANADIEYAKSAQAWAKEVDARLAAPSPAQADPAADTKVPAEDVGPFTLRGPEIGLVIGAIVLIGIIVKLVILG